MSTLTTYKWLEVLTGGSPQAGGNAISENFKKIADRVPKSNWVATSVPGDGDDETQGYSPGSMWLSFESGTKKLWVCRDATESNAVWWHVQLT